ncbi:hypothetical protein AGOR_G00245770 [Albula goreensis]|uniref:Uncharacterized protein n=1 Tax=Albula goreensis TaxID=1534307 RepID=A0A8T3CDR6_9TELE|nr:hypothetical protein AGOR_G00245770 [Albula goreensis]
MSDGGQQRNEGMTTDRTLLAVVTDDSQSQNPEGKSMDGKGAHMGLEAIYCQPGYELKIMLVGKSREENRRVGNIILGEQKFKEGRSRLLDFRESVRQLKHDP